MIIVITGASAGIGSAIAHRFAKDAHKLVLLARRKEKLDELRDALDKSKTFVFAMDVTSKEEVEETFFKIESEVGEVDILVNNAGLAFGMEPAQAANLDDWHKCVDVNINGLLNCTHAVLPHMVKRNRGHIINLGSVAGTYPYPGGHVYCGTKAFVHQFSLALRADLLGTQVRVSCIEPGLVGGTDFFVQRFRGDEKKAGKVFENTKALAPEDIAEVVHFCTTVPPHVNINTVEVMPVSQAFQGFAVYKK